MGIINDFKLAWKQVNKVSFFGGFLVGIIALILAINIARIFILN